MKIQLNGSGEVMEQDRESQFVKTSNKETSRNGIGDADGNRG